MLRICTLREVRSPLKLLNHLESSSYQMREQERKKRTLNITFLVSIKCQQSSNSHWRTSPKWWIIRMRCISPLITIIGISRTNCPETTELAILCHVKRKGVASAVIMVHAYSWSDCINGFLTHNVFCIFCAKQSALFSLVKAILNSCIRLQWKFSNWGSWCGFFYFLIFHRLILFCTL